jgi:hypothetical protein
MPRAPVGTQVKAATVAGAGSAGVITPFAIWVLDQIFFNGAAQPDVPLPLIGVTGLIISGACTFAGGWYARHTAPPVGGTPGPPAETVGAGSDAA